MCVIILKHKDVAMPTKKELLMAFNRNHDGCGFVSESDHYKSLDFEDFYARLKKVPKCENCIIHFRWATHGKVSLANCHPFYDEKSDTWFMHNGILNITPFKGKTDSETAFRKYLAPTIQKYGLYSKELQTVAGNIIDSSKFAFMQNGQIKTFGRFIEYKGCYYSNLYHLPYTALDYRHWLYAG